MGLTQLAPANTYFCSRSSTHGCAMAHASLAPKRFHRFHSHSVPKTLPIVDRCPVKTNTADPKTGALQMSPKTRNEDLLENGWCDIGYSSVSYGDHLF